MVGLQSNVTFMIAGLILRLMGSGVATYLGGRDVESNNCRSDCPLRLRFVRNSPFPSLVARRNRRVVRGQRLSEGWSSPHCYERCRR
jgi:hypothetical protein